MDKTKQRLNRLSRVPVRKLAIWSDNVIRDPDRHSKAAFAIAKKLNELFRPKDQGAGTLALPPELRIDIYNNLKLQPSIIHFRFEPIELRERDYHLLQVPVRRPGPPPVPQVLADNLRDTSYLDTKPQITDNTRRAAVIKNKTHPFVNKEWQTSKEFWTLLGDGLSGLGSSHTLLDVGTEILATVGKVRPDQVDRVKQLSEIGVLANDMMRENEVKRPEEPFKLEIEAQIESVHVRPATDWFYLENYLTTWTRHARMNKDLLPWCDAFRVIANPMLSLEDLYTGLCMVYSDSRVFDHYTQHTDVKVTIPDSLPSNPPTVLTNESPGVHGILRGLDVLPLNHGYLPNVYSTQPDNYTFSRRIYELFLHLCWHFSTLEEVLILVGPMPDGNQPTADDFEDIETEWTGNGVEGDNDPTAISTVPEIGNPEYRSMMSFVKKVMELLEPLQTEFVFTFLDTNEARSEFLSQNCETPFTDWLSTSMGNKWLQDSRGRSWLNTDPGRWWLSSSSGGIEWLDSHEGLQWLLGEYGPIFLSSPFATLWVLYGINTDYEVGKKQDLREHEYFKREEGKLWYKNMGYSDRRPAHPRRLTRDSRRPAQHYDRFRLYVGSITADRLNMFMNPPKRWSFIKRKDNYPKLDEPAFDSKGEGVQQ
ncbi:hypothetical protein F5Y18DRAFT_25234 [Xylariaceae sp. FL1019]|nr:hypothetical protein F5Y18DRAFT_25234 [Xylariaceae sp. FL1019]